MLSQDCVTDRGIEMITCDICNEHPSAIVDLKQQYQTEDIKQICPSCEKVINKQLGKMHQLAAEMNQSLIKRFMAVSKGESK